MQVPEEPYVTMLKVLDAAEVRPSGATSSPLPSTNGIPAINLIDPSLSTTPLSTEGELGTQAEDEGEGEGEDGESSSLAVAGPIIVESVDWGAVDEEVDAFLNETDDDDEDGMDDPGVSESGSGYVSDSSTKSGVSKYVQPVCCSTFPHKLTRHSLSRFPLPPLSTCL